MPGIGYPGGMYPGSEGVRGFIQLVERLIPPTRAVFATIRNASNLVRQRRRVIPSAIRGRVVVASRRQSAHVSDSALRAGLRSASAARLVAHPLRALPLKKSQRGVPGQRTLLATPISGVRRGRIGVMMSRARITTRAHTRGIMPAPVPLRAKIISRIPSKILAIRGKARFYG